MKIRRVCAAAVLAVAAVGLTAPVASAAVHVKDKDKTLVVVGDIVVKTDSHTDVWVR
jgi:hypothetical protein